MRAGQILSVAASARPTAAGDSVLPDAASWERIAHYCIVLRPAPPVHPSAVIRGTQSPQSTMLHFSVASDGARFFVRLQWRDDTRDVVSAFDRFADAAAVELALDDGVRTSYMMGSADAPVNIRLWKADTPAAQDLAAAGFGTTTALAAGGIAAAGRYVTGDRSWTVVFARPLRTTDAHQAVLAPGRAIPLAFAVWEGSLDQRDGHELTSTHWVTFQLPP